MRNVRRWVSLLLVLVMSLSMIQIPAFAAGGDTAYEGWHKGSITAIAMDREDGQKTIPGVMFMLEDITAGRYSNLGTFASGHTWSSLSEGTYRLTQVSTPNTYVENVQSDIIVINETTPNVTKTFYSTIRGSILISRVDSKTGNLVKGGTYVVKEASTGRTVWGPGPNIDGTITVPALPNGNYIVEEVAAPEGYTQLTGAQHCTVRGGSYPVAVTFSDAAWATVTVYVRDSVTGAPIEGAHIVVTSTKGTQMDAGDTNAAGIWTSKALEPGEYTVAQVAPAVKGYQAFFPSNVFTIKTDGESQVFNWTNTPLGSLTIVAYDSITGQPLPGATVTLRDSQNQIVTGPGITNPIVTGPSGEAVFHNLPDGHYTATIVGPDGHVMDTVTVTTDITGGSNEYVNVTGTEKGSLLIRCIDADTGKGLSGATFTIRRMNGDYIGDITTGADGTATMGNLESGQYLIEQNGVPVGYVKVTQTMTGTVSPGKITEVKFVNRTKPFIVVETMVKGTRMPIEGSTVTLVDSTGKEIRRGYTDINGQVVFEDLEPGTYTAKYTAAPDGYTIEVASQTVVVERYASGYALLTAVKHSAIMIEKLDAQTGAPLSGAVFQIRNSLGVPVGLLETDKTGFATSEVLTPGRYTIREMYAPNKYVPTTEIREVTVVNNESRHEVFTNTAFSGIVIYAYDNLGNPLPNVPYIVYQIDKQGVSTEVAHVVTNNSGIARTGELAPGRYMVTETTIPEGFSLVNPTESHIELFAGETNYVRFVHVPQSTILIQTADRFTGAAIPGAEYQITSYDSSYTANFKADENGEAMTEKLEQGIYYVKQIVAPEGYLLNTTTQTIQVLRDQVNQAKFFNTPISRIEIQSVIAGSNFGLEECSFTVEDSNGKEVFHATTDATGLLMTGELAPGRYTVKEIACKDGYTIVQSSRTVDVTTGIPTSVKFEHIAYTSIIISLVDFEDSSKGLPNSKFIIETLGGQYVTDVVTDSAGRAETEILPAGTYIVRQETAPEGYLLETTYQWINLTSNSCARLEFSNKRVSGLIIESFMLNSHDPVPGTVFEIAHENGKVVKTVTADASGVIQVTDLDPDVYVIKELSTPAGYTAMTLTQKVTVTFGASTTATFYHTGKSALVIRLTDAITAEPLSGGIFRVANSRGDIILNDAMTDADGQITVAIMEAGKYTVSQIKAPDGYSIDTNPVTVEVRDEQTAYANITNHKDKGLTIEVIDTEGNYLDGAAFEIINSENIVVDTVNVGVTGIAFIENLKAGVYTVKQTKVPAGWTSRTMSQTVTIGQTGDATLKFVHTNKSSLVVTLVDAQTKAPIAGGVFELRDSKGNVVKSNLITDDAGLITVPSLNAGRYTLVQISTAEGYSIDKTTYTVDIKDDQTCEITVTNHKNKGLTIEVLDDANNHIGVATFEVYDANGTLVGSYVIDESGTLFIENLKAGKYTVKEIKVPEGWTARTLTQDITIGSEANATLKFYHSNKSSLVINLTDALTGDPIKGGVFKIVDSKGNEIKTNLMTDESGTITVPSMNAGVYTITQTKTIDGYVIDQPVVSVTINDNQTATVNVTNHRMTNLVINVLAESDESFLKGGTFEVRDASTNVVVGTYQNDSTGIINVDSIAPGKYIVKEVSAPDGWAMKTASQEVTITTSKSALLKFYHTQKSNLTVNLKDATSGDPLEGAVYRITAANGDFVGEYTTSTNGQFVVASLTAGTYTVTMIKAPTGYEIDNTPYTVVVKDDKTIVLDLTLKFISNFRLVNTVKQTGEPLGGVAYKINTYDGTLVGNYTTDDAGLINVELKAGHYTMYQMSVPNGVVKNTTVWDVEIKAGENKVLEVQNEIQSRITIKFVDATAGTPIMGVKVQLKEKETLDYLGEFTSDDLGEIILTDVLNAGKYTVTMLSCPDSYNKDVTPRTIEVKVGETTEIVWKLSGHQGQIVINTWAGESSAMLQVAQNTKIGGAVYEIKDTTGRVVTTVTGDANGVAYSGALPLGTYTVQMISPPMGFQLNSGIATVVVTSASDNKVVDVYLKAAIYALTVNVTGQMTGWSGQMMKYAFTNCGNQSNVGMSTFYLNMKIPTDCMRGITVFTGVWNQQTYANIEYKTNQNGYRTLAQGISSKSNVSFDISTQSLGLGTNEYVTDVRIVFSNVMAGFKATMAPTLYTQVLTGIRTGYQAVVRAEVGGQLAYAGVVNGNQNLAGGSWCTGQGQYTSYIYGYTTNYPNTLPKTGF